MSLSYHHFPQEIITLDEIWRGLGLRVSLSGNQGPRDYVTPSLGNWKSSWARQTTNPSWSGNWVSLAQRSLSKDRSNGASAAPSWPESLTGQQPLPCQIFPPPVRFSIAWQELCGHCVWRPRTTHCLTTSGSCSEWLGHPTTRTRQMKTAPLLRWPRRKMLKLWCLKHTEAWPRSTSRPMRSTGSLHRTIQAVGQRQSKSNKRLRSECLQEACRAWPHLLRGSAGGKGFQVERRAVHVNHMNQILEAVCDDLGVQEVFGTWDDWRWPEETPGEATWDYVGRLGLASSRPV